MLIYDEKTKLYDVWLRLERTVYDVEARDEDEAFQKAVDIATDGAFWENKITEVKIDDD